MSALLSLTNMTPAQLLSSLACASVTRAASTAACSVAAKRNHCMSLAEGSALPGVESWFQAVNPPKPDSAIHAPLGWRHSTAPEGGGGMSAVPRRRGEGHTLKSLWQRMVDAPQQAPSQRRLEHRATLRGALRGARREELGHGRGARALQA